LPARGTGGAAGASSALSFLATPSADGAEAEEAMDENEDTDEHAHADDDDAMRHVRQLLSLQLEVNSRGHTPLANGSLAASDVSSFVGPEPCASPPSGSSAAEEPVRVDRGHGADEQRSCTHEPAANTQVAAQASAAQTGVRPEGQEGGAAARGKAPTATASRVLLLVALVAGAASARALGAVWLSSGVRLSGAQLMMPSLGPLAAGHPVSTAAADSVAAIGWAAGKAGTGSAVAAAAGDVDIAQLLATRSPSQLTQPAHGVPSALPATSPPFAALLAEAPLFRP
jgi:hypothetical protein